MTPQDEAILAQQDQKTLAEWWCILNSWEWPDELPDPEDDRHNYTIGNRRSQLTGWIITNIGLRACLRHHNHKMNDEEFEDFWRGTYERDEAARARHEKRVTDRIRAKRL